MNSFSGQRKFYIHTLGCKVNQYESDKIRSQLLEQGFIETDSPQGADIRIVHTCAVTKEAERKSRQIIRKMYREEGESQIYAIGCASEIPHEAYLGLPENVHILDNKNKMNLVPLLTHPYEKEEKEKGREKEVPSQLPPPISNLHTDLPPPTSHLPNRVRAYLKVQDGCDSFCSYCIIPYLRGRSISRCPSEILKELNRLEQQGFKEVVLTGVHLGDYGRKTETEEENNPLPPEKRNLTGLVELLLKNSRIPRIRLSSLEPMDFSPDLLELFKSDARLCRHLHLPLQHASDKILNLMGRNYTLEQYDRSLRSALSSVEDMMITADVMVGFPGEEEEDFEIMLNYIEKTPFLKLHCFPFSPHPRTRAAKMANQVPSHIKKDRMNRILELSIRKTAEMLEKFKGRELEVLVETLYPQGEGEGHTDNYLQVRFGYDSTHIGKINDKNKIITVKIKERIGEKLYGKRSESLLQ